MNSNKASFNCGVIVMAKAPVAGYAKTRLIPALGAAGAAALAERLLCRAVEQALAAGLGGAIEICCAPDTDHPSFARMAEKQPIELHPQGLGDLGARMNRAFQRRLAGAAGPVLLIGTDAPSLDAAILATAALALRQADAVFVPALDGGYALVGLRRPAACLFEAVSWSTVQVMAQTRERLKLAGLQHIELAPVADIDEPADLVHLPAGWVQ
ncbi:TIGR04282 family arsenosugar biosynthesis glycosyltransferase [Roseateles oligotrophus]|uniref:TIGR04282 family arsenosugar biosynthesis glycosyltransferase n=1 Tax=Roseateles oligotrophus TaxID=1769250 RepID=A0ABT2YH32_9BURK|nr:TIGR04282 family arsenosugar biosynthesis glycosyltransferase [Roseateles oligotrophus]MCV2369366.1 TIGR04282 family arsenosugar biosynthesis glycosyltransferase [Roseateles oligotrophus]